MQTAAKANRIFTEFSSIQGFAHPSTGIVRVGSLRDTLLSHLALVAKSRTATSELAKIGIRLAESAYSFRDVDALEEASAFLMSLPSSRINEIGTYYHALALKRKGSIKQATALCETVSSRAPQAYQARAIQTLGAICRDENDLSGALRFQMEALRAATSRAAGLQASLMARLSAATIQSDYGDHQGALNSLESLAPLVLAVARSNPFYFYVYQNALAVELGEVGKTSEAVHAISIVLRSPFASAYPEFLETRNELDARQQASTSSFVAVNPFREQTGVVVKRPRRRKQPKQETVSRPVTKRLIVRAPNSFSSAFINRTLTRAAHVRPTPKTPVVFVYSNRLALDRLGESSPTRGPPGSR
jgi:hypothetical protein